MNAREITATLKGRWYSNHGMIQCPAHEDRTPSCKTWDGSDGPLFHCYA